MGLASLHAAGVTHFGVKAHNLLLLNKLQEHTRATTKVTDLGMLHLSQTGTIEPGRGRYDVNYMAQEQHSKQPPGQQQEVTHQVDVFAHGLMLWFLYTGCAKEPFHDLNRCNVSSGRHLEQFKRPAIPESPGRVLIHLAFTGTWLWSSVPEVCELMRDCWQTEPQHRPEFYQVVERIRPVISRLEAQLQQEQK